MKQLIPMLIAAILLAGSNIAQAYYDSTAGRFLSADPLGHTASMDLYSYCNGDPINGFDPDGRMMAKGVANIESDASTAYNYTVLGAYVTTAIDGDILSGGQWSQPADDQHVTANQMYYQWVMGTGSSTRNFDQTSVLGQQMIQSNYVQSSAQSAAQNVVLNQNFSQVYVGRNLAKENMAYYAVIDFPNDVLLGSNPARGLQGSIFGLTTPLSGATVNNGSAYVDVNVSMTDRLSGTSGTRFPPLPIPGLNGYAPGHPASLLGNNPFGPNGPMRTITTNYNLNFGIPVDTSKIPPLATNGAFP